MRAPAARRRCTDPQFRFQRSEVFRLPAAEPRMSPAARPAARSGRPSPATAEARALVSFTRGHAYEAGTGERRAPAFRDCRSLGRNRKRRACRQKGNRGHRLWTQAPCICTAGLGQRVSAVRRAYALREWRQSPAGSSDGCIGLGAAAGRRTRSFSINAPAGERSPTLGHPNRCFLVRCKRQRPARRK